MTLSDWEWTPLGCPPGTEWTRSVPSCRAGPVPAWRRRSFSRGGRGGQRPRSGAGCRAGSRGWGRPRRRRSRRRRAGGREGRGRRGGANASISRSLAPCSRTPRSCCWMRRRRRWTPNSSAPYLPGRRLCRLQPPLCGGEIAGAGLNVFLAGKPRLVTKLQTGHGPAGFSPRGPLSCSSVARDYGPAMARQAARPGRHRPAFPNHPGKSRNRSNRQKAPSSYPVRPENNTYVNRTFPGSDLQTHTATGRLARPNLFLRLDNSPQPSLSPACRLGRHTLASPHHPISLGRQPGHERS